MSDLIRREDAIEVIKGNNYGYPGDYTEVNGNAAIDDIMSLPSAERKGEWIEQHENGHGFWVGVCSQCGEEKLVDNYCPNCGARMSRGERKNQ